MDNRTREIAIIAIAIVLISIMSIGVGYAFRGETQNSGNNLDVGFSVVAKDNDGHMYLQIPTATYSDTDHDNVYSPGTASATLQGKMTINCGQSGGMLVMLVKYDDDKSWAAIKKISFSFDDAPSAVYVCYDYEHPELMTPPLTVSTVTNKAFTISVEFKDISLNPGENPSAYTGSNMVSDIIFIVAELPNQQA